MAMARPSIGQRTLYQRRSIPMIVVAYIEDIFVSDANLTSIQLRNLSNHKYSAQDNGLCARWFMNDFWNVLVEQYPLWLAPNLITLIGLLCNMMSVLLVAYYSPDGKGQAPGWSYALCAVMLFIYQSLDATDGKQARRTNTASPMGELFDHGCDSLSQIFVSLEICLSIQYGFYPSFMLLICMYAITLFYLAHWQTYVCGTLRFGEFDVTEGQFCVMLVCMISAVFGPEFWGTQVVGIEVRWLLLVFGFVPSCMALIANTRKIFADGAGKYGSTVADTSVLSPFLPLLAVIVPPMIIYSKSTSGAFEEHLVLYCITFGLVGSKITNRLIIAHMSKSELTFWDIVYIVPTLLMANQYFNILVDEYKLLIFCCGVAALILVINARYVCMQISSHMGIEIFTIPHSKSAPAMVQTAEDSKRS